MFSSNKLEGNCEITIDYAKLTNDTRCWVYGISPQNCPLPKTINCSFKADVSEYTINKILNGLTR